MWYIWCGGCIDVDGTNYHSKLFSFISVSITSISAELEGVFLSYNFWYTSFSFLIVMQRDLDKIERFANKIVEQSNIPTIAAQKLLKDVKVRYRGIFYVEL